MSETKAIPVRDKKRQLLAQVADAGLASEIPERATKRQLREMVAGKTGGIKPAPAKRAGGIKPAPARQPRKKRQK